MVQKQKNISGSRTASSNSLEMGGVCNSGEQDVAPVEAEVEKAKKLVQTASMTDGC